MAVETYTGSCHCGAIRFEADLDLDEGSMRCNCSYCAKARTWFAFAKGPERFRLLDGTGVSDYRWTPPVELGAQAHVRLIARDDAGNSTVVATQEPIQFDNNAPPPRAVGGYLAFQGDGCWRSVGHGRRPETSPRSRPASTSRLTVSVWSTTA